MIRGSVFDDNRVCSGCSGFYNIKSCSGFMPCSGAKWRSVFSVCSGIFCGKLVHKAGGKFVGNMWKVLRSCVEKKVLHTKIVNFGAFPRTSGKVFHVFSTRFYLCKRPVLHNFHSLYYNYY